MVSKLGFKPSKRRKRITRNGRLTRILGPRKIFDEHFEKFTLLWGPPNFMSHFDRHYSTRRKERVRDR
jgi:hypothetical protein